MSRWFRADSHVTSGLESQLRSCRLKRSDSPPSMPSIRQVQHATVQVIKKKPKYPAFPESVNLIYVILFHGSGVFSKWRSLSWLNDSDETPKRCENLAHDSSSLGNACIDLIPLELFPGSERYRPSIYESQILRSPQWRLSGKKVNGIHDIRAAFQKQKLFPWRFESHRASSSQISFDT